MRWPLILMSRNVPSSLSQMAAGGGGRVHAVIVPRGRTVPEVETLINHCKTLIARYKCPRTVEFRTALPLSPAGKILKSDLRAPYWEGRRSNVV